MQIPKKEWMAYINRLALINKKAADSMLKYIQKNGLDDIDALTDCAYGIIVKYGEGAGAFAAQMYDLIAYASGKILPPAEPAPTPEYWEVQKAICGTVKTGNEKIVSDSVSRLVKRTGVDTTMKNAIRDGAEWAWIPQGDTCAFCLTLASNGWQKASASALKGGHAEHIHANCDCTYAIRFNSNTNYAGYNPGKYYSMYMNASDGNSKDKINALRRELYQENKDEINKQHREAYARRQEAEEEE